MSDAKEKALATAVAAIYFNDNSGYGSALWDIVADLGGSYAADLLMEKPKEAYTEFVEGCM